MVLNMATMLGFIATDVGIAQKTWMRSCVKWPISRSTCITIDGDTSTNDSFIVMASGASEVHIAPNQPEYAKFAQALTEVAQELAQLIVRDGEGATKFISIVVENARDEAEAKTVAYSVAHSPLVKTAFCLRSEFGAYPCCDWLCRCDEFGREHH